MSKLKLFETIFTAADLNNCTNHIAGNLKLSKNLGKLRWINYEKNKQ